LDVTLTMPTGEPESEVYDHIEIRVRDSRTDAGKYGYANEYVFGTLYISSQTNELRFWASEGLTEGMEARYANVPLPIGPRMPSKWLWQDRMMRRALHTRFGMWLWQKRHTRRTRKLNRVKGTR
jgi:hypothetical protein